MGRFSLRRLFLLFLILFLFVMLKQTFPVQIIIQYGSVPATSGIGRLKVPAVNQLSNNHTVAKYNISVKQRHGMNNSARQHFSSLSEAEHYMWSMDINRAATVSIAYANFTRIMPHFGSSEDRNIFLVNQRIRDNFIPNSAAQLKGVVEIIPNGTFQGPFNCGFTSEYSHYRVKRTPSAGKTFKYLCPLLIPDGHAFQLFLDGTLPKIAQAYGILHRPDVTVILPKPRDKIVASILKKLGITEKRITYLDLRDTHTVYKSDYLISTCITPPLHPVLWTRMRKLMGVHEQLTVPVQDSTVLLLTRAGSHNAGRKIVNTEDVETMLRERYPGQVEVFKGGYDFFLADFLVRFGGSYTTFFAD